MKPNLSISCRGLTAGEDQLPQERANVTKGSDNSNPNMNLAVISSFFAPFEKVCSACRGKLLRKS